MMYSQGEVFLYQDAVLMNQARLDHLEMLNLDLPGKRVLEVGAGMGLLTHFFEDQGCIVLTTDGRAENVLEIRRRFPYRNTQVLDLETVFDLSYLGEFDIVFCYGTLYHLSNPEQALESLSKICREMILLETCVTPGDELAIHLEAENKENPNQATSGMGCRPTRPWIFRKLKDHYGYAYISKYQPCHEDFILGWQSPRSQKLYRSVFVGSKAPLSSVKLLSDLPFEQTYDPEVQPVWIDVGAHLGQTTQQIAKERPWIKVYAFEPNAKLAEKLAETTSALPNYVVIPSAIASQDGFSNFYLNAADATSSLLPFDSEGLQQWIGGEQIKVEQVVLVPTMRLDTFLNQQGIQTVEYLKIDAQGADFDVVVSAGERIRDIAKIKLEVAITPTQLYAGAKTKSEIIDYLKSYNFVLVAVETQSYGQEENLTFIQLAAIQEHSCRMAVELESTRQHLFETQHQLEQTQTNLNDRMIDLEREVGELNRVRQVLQDTENKLSQTQTTLAQTQEAYQSCQAEKEQLQTEKEQLQTLVTAMQTSKFWKVRSGWIKFKQKFGFAKDELLD